MSIDEIPEVLTVAEPEPVQLEPVEALARRLLSIELDDEGRARPRSRRAERESTYNATRARLRWPEGHTMTAAGFLAALDETRRTPV